MTARMCSMQALRRGLPVSPDGLCGDHLVEGEIGDRLAQALVLGLELLQALDLIELEPAELVAPAVARGLRDPDRARRRVDRLSLRYQHVYLPQLGDNPPGRVPLSAHLTVHDSTRFT